MLDRTATTVSIEMPKRPKSVTLFGGSGADDGSGKGAVRSGKGGNDGCAWRYDKRTSTLEITLSDHASAVDTVVAIAE